MKKEKVAVIIGAGPAGLTAAYEFQKHTDIKPIVIEADSIVGGISRTVDYKGNKIDIGGHRFFSKSQKVMDWWENILPFPKIKDDNEIEDAVNPEKNDKVMLLRNRLSRILYLRKFFNYPISLSIQTIRNLGLWKISKIGVSYIWARIVPRTPEKSLEDFFINRFGTELYKTFFKDYTEKLWGVDCGDIKADWGAQRIKGLSVRKTLIHALSLLIKKTDNDIAQKNVETSLIERFLYPKYGPGQMWETVRDIIVDNGADLYMNHIVNTLHIVDDTVVSVTAKNTITNKEITIQADYIISTMPVRDLIAAMDGGVSTEIKTLAQTLTYRDFMTTGLLCKKLRVTDDRGQRILQKRKPNDTWIYIQEPDVKMGRIQFFNNWSPYLVQDEKNTVWIGLEYFVNEGDTYWEMSDEEFIKFSTDELVKIGMVEKEDVLDAVVIRMPKAYPSYFGEAYERFDDIRATTNKISNLFLVGRNGMHRYNNSDHSMLAAMTAVENIRKGVYDKENIWHVNVEKEYHEEK